MASSIPCSLNRRLRPIRTVKGKRFACRYSQSAEHFSLAAASSMVRRLSASDLVLDPACGSGGFLLYALDYVRHKGLQFHDTGSNEHYRYWHEFAERRLFGIEINDEIS